jgi:hypothetical protein
VRKQKPCVYTKSNRGGPRVSRKSQQRSPQQRSESQQQSERSNSSDRSSQDDHDFDALSISSMIQPGAGLKTATKHPDNIDEIFDSIFGTKSDQADVPVLRVYDSDRAM